MIVWIYLIVGMTAMVVSFLTKQEPSLGNLALMCFIMVKLEEMKPSK